MLIQQKAEVVGVLDVQVKTPLVLYDTPLDKDNFEVSVIYSDQSRRGLEPEEYTLTPVTASSSAGPMEVTVHWTEGGLDGNAVLEVAGQISITSEMVEKGVTDAQTGQTVVLKEGDVTIPELIIWEGKTYYVTGIGNHAFYNNRDITQISFPKTLKRIGDAAFYNCSGLTGELKIPESVTSIGTSAFYNCWGLTGELKIPESVTSIGNSAFENCSGLTGELKIPESVTSIGNSAFGNCRGLTGELKIPESVTSIGNYAFRNCSGLTGELKIPESVTSIGYGAFYLTNFLTITIDNTKDAIPGAPWGWSAGADAVIWLRDDSTDTTE